MPVINKEDFSAFDEALKKAPAAKLSDDDFSAFDEALKKKGGQDGGKDLKPNGIPPTPSDSRLPSQKTEQERVQERREEFENKFPFLTEKIKINQPGDIMTGQQRQQMAASKVKADKIEEYRTQELPKQVKAEKEKAKQASLKPELGEQFNPVDFATNDIATYSGGASLNLDPKAPSADKFHQINQFFGNDASNVAPYFDNRVKAVDSQIAQIKQNPMLWRSLNQGKSDIQEIEKLKDYKLKLAAASNKLATDYTAWLYPDASLEDKGNLQRKFSGDPSVHEEIAFKEKGIPLTDEQKFKNAKVGVDVERTRLENDYRDIPLDQRDDIYYQRLAQVNDMDSKLLNQFPDYKKSQVGMMIAQLASQDPNIDASSRIGFIPHDLDQKTIDYISKTYNQPKELFEGIQYGDIPNQFMGNVPSKAATTAGLGVVTATTRLLGTALGIDSDRLTHINNMISGIPASVYGDDPYKKGSHPQSIIDINPTSSTYLQSIPNPKAGKSNYNLITVSHGIVEGAANFAAFMGGLKLATKGVQAAEWALMQPLTVEAEQSAAMTAYMTITNYENNWQRANEVLGKDASEAGKATKAMFDGYIDKLAFDVLPKDKLFLANEAKSIVDKELSPYLRNLTIKDINRTFLQTKVQKSVEGIVNTAKEVGHITGAISTAEISKGIINSVVGEGKPKEYMNEAWEGVKHTMIETPLSMALPLGVMEVVKAKQHSSFFKENVYSAGLEPNKYIALIRQELGKGNLTPEEANSRMEVVKTMHNIVQSTPDINPLTNKPFTHNQQVEYAYNRLKESGLRAKALAHAEDPAIASIYLRDAQDLADVRKAMLKSFSNPPKQAEAPKEKTIPQQKVDIERQRQDELEKTPEDADKINAKYDAEITKLSEQEELPSEKTIEEIIPKEQLDKTQSIMDRVANNENINEGEIKEAEDILYTALADNPKLANLIEPLILKLQNHENVTKTETVQTTERKPIEGTLAAKRKVEIKPALEQSEGSTARVVLADGTTGEGTLRIVDGNYVIEVEGQEPIVVGEKAITDRDLKVPEGESPVELDENGNVKSATFETKDGHKVTITDPEKALDLGIQLSLETVGEIPDEAFDRVYEDVIKEDKIEVPVEKPKVEEKVKPEAEIPKEGEPEQKPETPEQKEIKRLRAEEQAEYDAMPDPKDEAKRKEIYDKYDKLITPLLKKGEPKVEVPKQKKKQPKGKAAKFVAENLAEPAGEGEGEPNPEQPTKEKTGEEILKELEDKGTKSSDEKSLNELAEKNKGNKVKRKIIEQARKAIKTLKSIFPNMDIHLHENEQDFDDVMDKIKSKKGTGGNFAYTKNADGTYSGRIDINLDKANLRTIAHEVTHAVLFKAFGENQELFQSFRDKISKVLGSATDKNLQEFADNPFYKKTGVTAEEYLSELSGLLSSKTINPLTLSKIASAINEFVSKLTGGKFIPFENVNDAKDVVEFFDKVSSAIKKGNDLTNIVKEKIAETPEQKKALIESRMQAWGAFEKLGFEETDEFKKLVESGHIVKDYDLSEIAGMPVFIINPDNMLVGSVKLGDKIIGEGKGGVHFVSDTGDVWAFSDTSRGKVNAAKMAEFLNNQLKENGVAHIILSRGDLGKLFSSHAGARGAMRVLEALVDKKIISKMDFRNALKDVSMMKDIEGAKEELEDLIKQREAAIKKNKPFDANKEDRIQKLQTNLEANANRKYDINFTGIKLETIHNDVESQFFNKSDNSFSNRGTFVTDVIEHLAKNGDFSKEQINKLRKYLNTKELPASSERKTGNITFSLDSIKDAVGLLFSDEAVVGGRNSDAYAVIKVENPKYPIEMIKGSHESYGAHVRQVVDNIPLDKFLNENSNLQKEDLIINEKNQVIGIRPKLLLLSEKNHIADVVNNQNNEPTVANKLGSNTIGLAEGIIKPKSDFPEQKIKSKSQFEEEKGLPLESKEQKNGRTEKERAFGEVKINSEKVQYNGTNAIGSRKRTESEQIASRNEAKAKINNPETNASLKAANSYNESVGLPEVTPHKYKPSDPVQQTKLAKLYPKLEDVNSPTYKETDIERRIYSEYKSKHPEIFKQYDIKNYKDLVHKSYEQLIKETQLQYDALPVKVTFHEAGEGNYENNFEMLDDVHNFNHLWVYKGGDDHTELGSKTIDKDGLTANDKFRAVHDYYGHSVEGYQFGKDGEENAWIEHSKMFSPLAQWALSSETRGQNSWVNYSGVNDAVLETIKTGSALKKEGKKLGNQEMIDEGEKLLSTVYDDFKFAEQKAIILPPEFSDVSKFHTTKISEIPKQLRYDTENITGLPSKVGVGEEPIPAESKQGAGTEKTGAGGVLQAPGAEGKGKAGGKEGIKSKAQIDKEVEATAKALEGIEEKNGVYKGNLKELVSIDSKKIKPLNEDEEMNAWNNKEKAKKKNNWTDKQWAESILDVPTSQDPINATLKSNGEIVITDGHHRQLAAKILGKDLSVNLKVEGYESKNDLINAINKATGVSELPQQKGVGEAKAEIMSRSQMPMDKKVSDMKDILKEYVDEGKSLDEIKDILKDEFGDYYDDVKGIIDQAHQEMTTTGIKNAVTERERGERGLEEIEVEAKRSFGKVFDDAKQMIANGVANGLTLAAEIIKNPRPLKAEESAVLLIDRMRISNEYNKKNAELLEAQENGETDKADIIQSQMEALEEEMDLNDEAARKSGYEQGLGLAARRMLIAQDYSLVTQMNRLKAANGGKEVPKQYQEQLKSLITQLEEANNKLEEFEKKQAGTKKQSDLAKVSKVSRTPEQIAKEKQNIKSKIVSKWGQTLARMKSAIKGKSQIVSKSAMTPEKQAQLESVVKDVNDMVKLYAEGGETNLKKIIDNIHQDLVGEMPDLNKSDVEDIVLGKYDTEKVKTSLTPEKIQAQANVREVKTQIDFLKEELKNKQRSGIEKGMDYLHGWHRFGILSGVPSSVKIGTAALTRGIVTRGENLVGQALSLIPGIRRAAKRAPREGGINRSAEAKAFSSWFDKMTKDDIKRVMKTGISELDYLYGAKEPKAPKVPEWMEFFGRMHSAIKLLPKRAEFFRSLEMRTEQAIKEGKNPDDAVVQQELGVAAYNDALRAVFMQENILSEGFQGVVRKYEKTQPAFASGLKFLFPIVKVPSNYVAEQSSYVPIVALVKAITVGVQGRKGMTPEQADYFMRALKKGSIGTAFIALGFFNPGNLGGYYTGKRKKDDLEAGDIELFGVKLPHFMLHTPLLEMLQVGATMRRAAESQLAKGEEPSEILGIYTGGIPAVLKGQLTQIPFFGTSERIMKTLDNQSGAADKMKEYGSSIAQSIIEPQLMQNIADWTDMEDGKTVKRESKGLVEKLKEGAPGFKKTLKQDKSKFTDKEYEEFSNITEKGLNIPELNKRTTYKIKIDTEHPDGHMTEEEYDKFIPLQKEYVKDAYKKFYSTYKSDFDKLQKIINAVPETPEEKAKMNSLKDAIQNKIDNVHNEAIKAAKRKLGLHQK